MNSNSLFLARVHILQHPPPPLHFHIIFLPLSFSQVAVAHHRLFLCFGAVEEDGYEVWYNPISKEILFSISSFHHWHETDRQLYVRS